MVKDCTDLDIENMVNEVSKLEEKTSVLRDKQVKQKLTPEDSDNLGYFDDRAKELKKKIKDCKNPRESASVINTDNNKNKNKILALFVIAIVLVAGVFGLIYIRPALDLTGEGYAVNVNVGVNLLNGDLNDTVAIPRSSQLIQETPLFIDSFETKNNLGNWSTNMPVLWTQNNPRAYDQQYSVKISTTPIFNYFNTTYNTTIAYNETIDISYYAFKQLANITISGHYCLFSVIVNWTDAITNYSQSVKITNLMDSLGYVNGSNEIMLNNSFYRELWNGFLIRDVRTIVNNYNSSIYGQPFMISNMSFQMMTTQLKDLWIDYVKVTKNPDQFTQIWYYANHSTIGYQVTINYTVLINTLSFVNTSNLLIDFNIYNSIATLFGIIPPFLIENIRLTNMSFAINIDPFYDGIHTGNYTGRIIPFPKWNTYGNEMNYSFYARIEGLGLMTSNEYTNDVIIKDLPSQAFTLIWKKPLKVQ